MAEHPFVTLNFSHFDEADMIDRAASFYIEMKSRRTVRDFSDKPVSKQIIEHCLLTAGTSVSGANMQPWQFVVVGDAEIKRQLRVAAEQEEASFYADKAPEEWLQALAPLGTDANKPFLEKAPWLLAVFQQRFGTLPDGTKVKHYYAPESVGIATGVLITALHHAGLACLTHTPSPMGFMNRILHRPKTERPFLLLVVGYPQEGAEVPDINKKSLDQIATFI
jgi:iodotyrosine deiodinase